MPDGKNYPAESSTDDLLWRHLKTVPAFRALLRAVEARFYSQVHIPQPVLDLGCGDGHFARMALEAPVAAGVDPWWGPLQKARREGIYRLNVQALGNALPFAEATFGSVASNSVLEHIYDVQPVLAEANRVLRPGGLLLVTVPSHLFTEYLSGARILGPLGLGDAYRRFFNFISRHAHTDPPAVWAERLGQAGFRIVRWQYYFSRQALRALELGHVQGLPSAILHFLTGHWILAPWEGNLRLTERWLRPYYQEQPGERGAYFFFMARKMATEAVPAYLPDAEPLPVKEPEIGERPAGEAGAREPLPIPAGDSTAGALAAAPPTPATRTTEERLRPLAQAGSRTGGAAVGLGLLLLGFLLVMVGQSILSGQPQSRSGGLTLLALGWLAIGSATVYLDRRLVREPRQRLRPWPRRRWLLLPAILSVLLAQSVAGTSPFEGYPFPALVLWIAGIVLAFLALDAGGSDGYVGESLHENNQEAIGAASAGATSSVSPPDSVRYLLLPLALFFLALIVRLISLTEHPFVLNGVEASIGLDALAVWRGQISNPFATGWLTNPTMPLFLRALPIGILGRTVLGARILSALVGAMTIPALYILVKRVWSRQLALVAALLLAGYHLHVHYSRLGMNNVWDPLVTLLALGSLAYARQHSRRRTWLIAGVLLGLCAYFYMPSHLMPFMLPAIVLYLFLLDRPFVDRHWPRVLGAVTIAALVALPQYIYYQTNSGLFMERANVLGILQTDWLLQEAAASGRTPLAIVVDHFWRAALAFNATLDTSSTYNPGIPLLRYWPSLFFIVGLGVTVTRLRQFRYALVLIWLGTTVILGGALLVGAPDSHRFLIAAPAVVLVVAVGLRWLARRILQSLRLLGHSTGDTMNGTTRRATVLSLVTLVAILFVAGDLLFYFGAYRRANRFGDRNTEAAYEIAEYLNTLEGQWTAYFHGAPTMYVSFPTIPFLATHFDAQKNLFDVEDPGEVPPAQDSAGNKTFIYLPERSEEVNVTARRFPGGRFRTFEGRLANPLFYAYEVPK